MKGSLNKQRADDIVNGANDVFIGVFYTIKNMVVKITRSSFKVVL
jgi:hypothetical protein